MIKAFISYTIVFWMFVSCAPSTKQSIPPSQIPTIKTTYNTGSASKIEREIHQAINAFRMGKGLPKLSSHETLREAAETHSNYMMHKAQSKGNLLHINHDRFSQRSHKLRASGVSGSIAENVAVLQGIPESQAAERFVSQWINSKGHLKNILSNHRASGIAVSFGSNNTIYATQIFASP